jgi:putative transposase
LLVGGKDCLKKPGFRDARRNRVSVPLDKKPGFSAPGQETGFDAIIFIGFLILNPDMPRREVIFQSGNYYHVYNRGNNRQLIFFERDNYTYFLRQLRTHLINRGVDIIAYCLMPNHYHLLVYLKNEYFSKLMQAFTLSYAKAINQRYKRVGSLFQGRFQAIHVDKDEYLLNLTRYIHLNPVEANLVEKAEGGLGVF